MSPSSNERRAGFDYVDCSATEGQKGVSWQRLELSELTGRLLIAQPRFWGFLSRGGKKTFNWRVFQDQDWAQGLFGAPSESGTKILVVALHGHDETLAQRGAKRGDRQN